MNIQNVFQDYANISTEELQKKLAETIELVKSDASNNWMQHKVWTMQTEIAIRSRAGK
jgi:hypothetical protein